MERFERELMAKARRAYERGRLRRGLRAAAPAGLLSALSLPLSENPAISALIGLAAVLFASELARRGGPPGRAVGPGIRAGAGPLLLPLAVGLYEWLTGCASCGDHALACLLACVGGGLWAGLVLGAEAARAEDRVSFLLYGGLLAC